MSAKNREYLEQFRLTPAGQNLLRTIRYAEGTSGPKGYQTMFGGSTFDDLSSHPDKVINKSGYSSSAAGAYQFLTPTWKEVKSELGLEDFGPESQDIAALRLAQRRLKGIGGLETVRNEGFSKRVAGALAPEWASLPTAEGKSYYGQPVKSLEDLQSRYGMTNPKAGNPSPAPVSKKDAQNTTAVTPAVQQAEVDSQQSTTSGPYNSKVGRALNNAILNSVFSTINGNTTSDRANRYFQAAADLDELDSDEADDIAESLRMAAMRQTYNNDIVTQISNLAPSLLIQELQNNLTKSKTVNEPRTQSTVNDVKNTEIRQRAEVLSETKQAKSGTNKNIIITSASDTSGEPGFDYVVEGGKRGAEYYSPFGEAEVLKVVNDQNWETDLVKNPQGRRGYGNLVELRFAGPGGEKADALIAHFDSLNPALKPGMRIKKGDFIGTQGRTGSTTGAHISMDFYKPGSTTPNIQARDFVLSTIR